jgi:ketosteroid isomerase-like protein
MADGRDVATSWPQDDARRREVKKVIVIVILIAALALTGCGGVKADVPENAAARATQALVERYIAANQEYDADGLIALYADDLFWMDYGSIEGPISLGNLRHFVPETMEEKSYKLRADSYLVTADGRFAVIDVLWSQPAPSTGKWASTPAVVLLEFREGKIVSETWYYNDAPLH